ncbi:hypothetical protein HDE_13857 [Halotydeus destructor]|nr:hypothetical protein HDE_13857 [Halotydeus destructor]
MATISGDQPTSKTSAKHSNLRQDVVDILLIISHLTALEKQLSKKDADHLSIKQGLDSLMKVISEKEEKAGLVKAEPKVEQVSVEPKVKKLRILLPKPDEASNPFAIKHPVIVP